VTVRATTVEAEPRVFDVTFKVGSCLNALTTFVFTPQPGSQDIRSGSVILRDGEDPGDFGKTELYELDGVVELTQIGDTNIVGTATAIGVSVREVAEYYDDPGNWDFGNHQEYPIFLPGVGQFDYGVLAQFSTYDGSPDGTILEWFSENQVRVYFDASQSRVTHGLVHADIESWYWEFGDGTAGQGEMVDHIYTVGPRHEFTVNLRVTDGNGNSAIRTKVIRVATFDMPFTGWFSENGLTQCLSDGDPGNGCEGTLTIEGLRSGTIPQDWLVTSPGNTIGQHAIQAQHEDPND
jgi:hypothetical protein